MVDLAHCNNRLCNVGWLFMVGAMTDSELEGRVMMALSSQKRATSSAIAFWVRECCDAHTTETQVGRTLKKMEICGKVIRRASNGEGSPTWQLRKTPQQETTK